MDADDIRSWMADFILDGPDPARQEAFDAALAGNPDLRAEWAELQAAASLVDALPAEAWGPVDLEMMRERVHDRLDDGPESRTPDSALAELLAQPPVPDEELNAVWPQLLQASAWLDALPEPNLGPERLASVRERVRRAVAADSALVHEASKLSREDVRRLMGEFAEAGIDPARASLFAAALRSHEDLAAEWVEIARGLSLVAALPVAEVTAKQVRDVAARIRGQVRTAARAGSRYNAAALFTARRLAAFALAASVLGAIFISQALRTSGGASRPATAPMAARPPAAMPSRPPAATKMAEATPLTATPAAEQPGSDGSADTKPKAADKPTRKAGAKPKRRGRVDNTKQSVPDNGDVEGTVQPGGTTKAHASVAIVAEDTGPGKGELTSDGPKTDRPKDPTLPASRP